ncbi:MAG TPA: hypothetical protein VHD15_06370 [Hyphomicrobiales bacterium]|nr:hypothetical protein [Hyphomicrobiales bacterium]
MVRRHSRLDHRVYRFLTRRWSEEQRAGHLDRLAEIERDAEQMLARATFQTIDSKAAGLLTHVSMMIAALGVVAPAIVNADVEEAIIFAEIGLYLLIAIACLRCLALFAPAFANWADRDELKSWLSRELVLRQGLYGLCNRATIVLTVVVFISLPVLFVWHPEGASSAHAPFVP